MGKSTTSMAIFNSYVSLPEGKAKYIPSTNTVTCNWIPMSGTVNEWMDIREKLSTESLPNQPSCTISIWMDSWVHPA